MKLVSYEVQTLLGRFERIGALAHGTIVDLTSSCAAYFAESEDANAARRQAEAVVPPDMIEFLEGGDVGREMAGKAVAYAAERMRLEPRPLGPHGQLARKGKSMIYRQGAEGARPLQFATKLVAACTPSCRSISFATSRPSPR